MLQYLQLWNTQKHHEVSPYFKSYVPLLWDTNDLVPLSMFTLCAGSLVLLSYLSKVRSNAACAMYEDDFWIVGGTENGDQSLDIVESFSLR
jgi:hypothetical protein